MEPKKPTQPDRLDHIDQKREPPVDGNVDARGRAETVGSPGCGLPPQLSEFTASVDAAGSACRGDRAPADAARSGTAIPNPGQDGKRGGRHLSSASPETARAAAMNVGSNPSGSKDIAALAEDAGRGEAAAITPPKK